MALIVPVGVSTISSRASVVTTMLPLLAVAMKRGTFGSVATWAALFAFDARQIERVAGTVKTTLPSGAAAISSVALATSISSNCGPTAKSTPMGGPRIPVAIGRTRPGDDERYRRRRATRWRAQRAEYRPARCIQRDRLLARFGAAFWPTIRAGRGGRAV